MQVPVIANDISDLGDLGQRGLLKLVDHGDEKGLIQALDELFADPEATTRMVAAGRRLYLREFSYRAARENLEMIVRRAQSHRGRLEAAEEFADFYARFCAAQCPRSPQVETA